MFGLSKKDSDISFKKDINGAFAKWLVEREEDVSIMEVNVKPIAIYGDQLMFLYVDGNGSLQNLYIHFNMLTKCLDKSVSREFMNEYTQ